MLILLAGPSAQQIFDLRRQVRLPDGETGAAGDLAQALNICMENNKAQPLKGPEALTALCGRARRLAETLRFLRACEALADAVIANNLSMDGRAAAKIIAAALQKST